MAEANAAVMASELPKVEGVGAPPRACLDGDLVVCTYFYSHRWLRGAEDPPDPDGDYHTKAHNHSHGARHCQAASPSPSLLDPESYQR